MSSTVVRVIAPMTERGVTYKVGDTFETDQPRALRLQDLRLVQVVEVQPPVPEKAPEPTAPPEGRPRLGITLDRSMPSPTPGASAPTSRKKGHAKNQGA